MYRIAQRYIEVAGATGADVVVFQASVDAFFYSQC